MNKKYLIGVLLGIVCVGVIALLTRTIPTAPQPPGTLPVTASFYPLYFFAQQIGGDRVTVWNVTPAGAEPHDYEPTAQDIAHIEQSKVLVLNGGGLEPWGDSIRQNINPGHTTIVIAGEGLTTQHVMENNQDIIDPHVWLSPPLAKQMVDRITQGFITADPADASSYQANAAALTAELDDLDQAYRQGLAHCQQQNIVTSHAAFGYLATTYGLNQVPIAGLSPDAEPSAQQLAAIAQFAKNNHIHYIFFESLVSPKLSQTIATEVGAQTLVLNPIEGLTSDELAQGKDYFTEMRSNLAHLETALQCQP